MLPLNFLSFHSAQKRSRLKSVSLTVKLFLRSGKIKKCTLNTLTFSFLSFLMSKPYKQVIGSIPPIFCFQEYKLLHTLACRGNRKQWNTC